MTKAQGKDVAILLEYLAKQYLPVEVKEAFHRLEATITRKAAA